MLQIEIALVNKTVSDLKNKMVFCIYIYKSKTETKEPLKSRRTTSILDAHMSNT